MLKLFPLLSNLLFIANHALCNVAFIYFLNYHDTGRWDSDGWIFMAIGGVLCGTMALMVEHAIYRKSELWPHSRLLFFTRLITLSILFVTMSFALGYTGVFLLDWLTPDSRTPIVGLVVIPLMAIFYLPMIVPFGIVLGFMNGALLQLGHVFRMSGKSV